MADDREVRHVRAMFISDVHLGMKPIRVGQLIEFLRAHEAETIVPMPRMPKAAVRWASTAAGMQAGTVSARTRWFRYQAS